MDIDITPTDGGNGRVVTITITITGDNMGELPPGITAPLEDYPSTCSELLAALTMAAIILDRKQDAFRAGIREATALKAAKPSEIINAAHAATADLGDDNAFAGEVEPSAQLREMLRGAKIRVKPEDHEPECPARNAPPWSDNHTVRTARICTCPADGRRELKDRRDGGERRIFEATCLTANKRNVNRDDRRQGDRRK